jgi:uncharacterized protein (TIGR02453 family)
MQTEPDRDHTWISQATLDFLAGLQAHNTKSWFDAHKPAYLAAKAEFAEACTAIVLGIATFDPAIARSPLEHLKIFRINRDVRFSKDKSPYKTHFGGVIVPGGMQTGRPGYYIHLAPGGKSALAGGVWNPTPQILLRLRRGISAEWGLFKALLDERQFKNTFATVNAEEKLKKIPAGFDAADPAAEFLKFKSYSVWKELGDTEVLSADFVPAAIAAFGVLKALNDFLNRFL